MLVKRKLRTRSDQVVIEAEPQKSNREEVVITVYGGSFKTSMDVIARTEITVIRKKLVGRTEWWCENDPPKFSKKVTRDMWINRVTCSAPRSLWDFADNKEKELPCPKTNVKSGEKFSIEIAERVLVFS